MDLLISFVNQTYTPELKLGLFNTDTESFSWILRGIADVGSGATGLIVDQECLYVCVQQSAILVFDKSGLIQSFQPEQISDAHTLRVRDGVLYCTSSGSNEIFQLERTVDGQIVSEQLHWSMPGVSNDFDAVHLNSLEIVGDEIFASGFGERSRGQMWSEIESGFIINTEDNKIASEDIRHTHSLTASNQGLLFCESLEGAVKILGGSKEYRVGGYTRGLCLEGDIMLVGSSHRRGLSKSTGKLMKGRTEEFEDSGNCRVSAVNLNTGKIEKIWDLSAYGNEIYDLYPNPPAFMDGFCTTDPLAKRIQSFEKNGAKLLQRAEAMITGETAKLRKDQETLSKSLRNKDSEIDKLSLENKRLEEKSRSQLEAKEKQNAKLTSKILEMEAELEKTKKAQEHLTTLHSGTLRQLKDTESQLVGSLKVQKNFEKHAARLIHASLLKKYGAYKALVSLIKTLNPTDESGKADEATNRDQA